MMVDVSAVPMMHAPDPDPAGNELDEASWAALIDTLRPRLLALAPRELCNFCRESYYHDLLSLVISHPASEAVLERLQAALSEAVFDMLAEDCEKYGPSQLASDLACGTFKRIDALLTKFAAARATPEQIEQLGTLAQQMAQLNDGLFDVVLKNLKGAYLAELMKSSGGSSSDLAQRLSAPFDDRTWELLNRDSAEPISAKEAEEAIAELPVVLTGQDWKSPEQRWRESEEGQKVQRELDERRKRYRKSWPLWKHLWWHAESLWWKAYWKIGRIFIKPRP
jgi:hypothetical protein